MIEIILLIICLIACILAFFLGFIVGCNTPNGTMEHRAYLRGYKDRDKELRKEHSNDISRA